MSAIHYLILLQAMICLGITDSGFDDTGFQQHLDANEIMTFYHYEQFAIVSQQTLTLYLIEEKHNRFTFILLLQEIKTKLKRK